MSDDLDIELLKLTPSSFLGSCRYKLPDWHDDEAVYKKNAKFSFHSSTKSSSVAVFEVRKLVRQSKKAYTL